ncbi:phage protease, partial [Methylobacterium sp. sgz302541]|uniref:phage protease n=1 Tax=unclassified Methylobacterium TaxID=2615210 RepID=UPI003D352F59
SGKDGRGPYRAADPAAIMQTSRQLAGRNEIPVDYNHSIDLAATKGGPSPAAGWIKGLQARADGIWGLVTWTRQAVAQLAAREYRYLSPVFAHTPDGVVTAILRASVVNNPNLTQLTALASMETHMDNPNADGLADLRQLIGLPDNDGMPAILAAIRAMQTQTMASAGAPDPAKYVPIGDFVRVTQELNRVHQGVEAQTAKMHVEEQVRAGRLMPFMKDWAINLCTVNKPAFDEFMSKTGGSFAHLFKPTLQAAYRDPRPAGQASDLSDVDAHVATVLGLSPEQFTKAGQA